MHMVASTIMGKKQETSVTDDYGQTHDVDNLFTAGAGLIPTSGAVKPSFTMHALALRSVEYVLSERTAFTAPI